MCLCLKHLAALSFECGSLRFSNTEQISESKNVKEKRKPTKISNWKGKDVGVIFTKICHPPYFFLSPTLSWPTLGTAVCGPPFLLLFCLQRVISCAEKRACCEGAEAEVSVVILALLSSQALSCLMLSLSFNFTLICLVN